MSHGIHFLVLTPGQLSEANVVPLCELRHFGDFREYVSQFFELEGSETPTVTVPSWPVPQSFSLYRPDGESQGVDENRTDWYGERLRYTFLEHILEAVMPDYAGPLDRGMIAFLRELALDEKYRYCPVIIVHT